MNTKQGLLYNYPNPLPVVQWYFSANTKIITPIIHTTRKWLCNIQARKLQVMHQDIPDKILLNTTEDTRYKQKNRFEQKLFVKINCQYLTIDIYDYYITYLPLHPSIMISTKPKSSLTCSICGKVCKKLWSLSYHKRLKHSPGVGLEGFPEVQVDGDLQLSNYHHVTPAPAPLLLIEIVQRPTACITPGPAASAAAADTVPDTLQIYKSSDSEYEMSEGSDRVEYQDNLDSTDDDSGCEIVSDDDVSAIQDADHDDNVFSMTMVGRSTILRWKHVLQYIYKKNTIVTWDIHIIHGKQQTKLG